MQEEKMFPKTLFFLQIRLINISNFAKSLENFKSLTPGKKQFFKYFNKLSFFKFLDNCYRV